MYNGVLWLKATDETTLHMGVLHGDFSSQFDALIILEIKMRSLCMLSDVTERPITEGI